MIDKNKLSIGSKVYIVNEKCNAFIKNKLKMIDENGIEWYRYDRPNWEYSITEAILCGLVNVTIIGEVDENPNRQNEFHFKYPDGKIYYEYDSDIDTLIDLFYTKEEAEEYIEVLKVKRAE